MEETKTYQCRKCQMECEKEKLRYGICPPCDNAKQRERMALMKEKEPEKYLLHLERERERSARTRKTKEGKKRKREYNERYKKSEKYEEFKRRQRERYREESNSKSESYLRRQEYSNQYKNNRIIDDPIRYICSRMLIGTKSRAKKLGIPFDLTLSWIEERVKAGTCEVTNLPFDIFGTHANGRFRSPWVPSLDRTSSGDGYTMNNVKVVVWLYNAAKNEATIEEFATFITAMSKTLTH